MRIKISFSITWPLYLTLPVLLLPVIFLERSLLQHTNGIFTLPGDEAFLQLSTARAVAFRHIWGICQFDFAAASSSLLYPLALVLPFFVFGASLVTVMATNTLLAVLSLALINRWLHKQAIRPLARLAVLMAITAFAGLPLMILSCTEGVLLLLMAFLFVRHIYDEWAQPEFSWSAYLYGALMVATRYDAMILVAAVCILLTVCKKGWLAAGLAAASILPAAVFGAIALGKGWYFIPNALILAGRSFLLSFDWLLGCGIALLLPLFYRNAPGIIAKKRHSLRWTTAIGALLLCLLLLPYHFDQWEKRSQASIRLYRQQYLIGQFARLYYRYRGIASDDIGLVSYMTDGRYLDLKGFANMDIAKAGRSVNAALLDRFGKKSDTQLAFVSSRYKHDLPGNWTKMGAWEIPQYGSPEKDIVSFYVVDTSWIRQMKRNMEDYSWHLPRDVTIRYAE